MNARLTRALAEGERYTPDADAVMAGVRAGITRARRRRRYASAGLAALAVLGLSGTAVLIGRPEHTSSRPADSAPPKAQARPVPPQECRLSFGWLPEGLAEPMRSCGPRQQSVLYPMDGGPYLSVSIDQSGWQGTATPTRGWKPLTVNGRAGQTVTRGTRSFVRFPLPSSRWVFLEYGVGMPGGKAIPGLDATALRIAEHISETDAGSLTVPFAPTYLPPGQRLAHVGQRAGGASVSVGYQDGSGRVIGESGAATTEDGVTIDETQVDTGTGYDISWSSDPGNTFPPEPGERIADIQGRPAYLLNQGSLLAVEGFHGGQLTISVSFPVRDPRQAPPKPGRLTPELVRIAEGVRWLG